MELSDLLSSSLRTQSGLPALMVRVSAQCAANTQEAYCLRTIYKSSSFAYRGFCSTCGSSLTFNYDREPEQTEINLGVIDEEILCGKRDETSAWDDEYGHHVPRVGGLGREICSAVQHIYMENAILGVTDDLPGSKWLTDRTEGKSFTGKPFDFKKGA